MANVKLAFKNTLGLNWKAISVAGRLWISCRVWIDSSIHGGKLQCLDFISNELRVYLPECFPPTFLFRFSFLHNIKHCTASFESTMTRTFLAFGPTTHYFIKYTNGWDARIQEQSSEYEMVQRLKVARVNPHCFAFGEGSWFVAYTYGGDKSTWKGMIHFDVPGTILLFPPEFLNCGWRFVVCIGDLYKFYPKLYTWLKGLKSFDGKELTVSLGPNGAYWAWSKGNGQSSRGLPRDLLEQLELHKRTKGYVTLGLNGSFIYWNDKGYSHYHINDSYAGAYNWLESRLNDDVQIVVSSSGIAWGQIS
jgi:hypothetical protein